MLELDFIETPENVELQRRLAGIGTRFLAGFVDSLWLLLIYLVLIVVFFLTSPTLDFRPGRLMASEGWWIVAALTIVAFVVYWGYYVFFELSTNGQSPGKKTMKIRVVKLEGGPITFTDVAIRNLLRVVDAMPIGYAVAGLFMFITKRSQRLGDLAAGTVVVLEGATSDYSATKRRADHKARSQEPAPPQTLRHSELTAQEYRLLSNYWSRRHDLTAEARQRVLPKLLLPILRRLGLPPAGGGGLAGLERDLAQLLFPSPSSPPPPVLPNENGPQEDRP